MKRVQVLLRDHVDNLGRCGDVVQVAAGYARNYLLPNRMAVPATEENVKMMQRRKARLDAEEAAMMADIQKRIDALSAVTVSTSGKADENGHLFGSVNAAAVAKLLEEKGFGIEEKDVRLGAPIKAVGTHEVPVHVHADLVATVKVEVKAEE